MIRNIIIKAVVILSLMSFLIGLIGCKGISFSSSSKTKSFSRMSQEEKQQYVADYLKEAYGVDYEISEIKKRQVDVFRSEKYYYATASYGKEWFTLWISDDGEVFATEFCFDISETIDESLSCVVSRYWEDYYVHDFLVFKEPYVQKWTKDDDLYEMFEKEKVINSVRLFLNLSNDREKDLLLFKQLQTELSLLDGAIFVYYCENPKDIDINTCDSDLYEECIFLN